MDSTLILRLSGFVLVAGAGCTVQPPSVQDETPAPAMRPVGGDRDAHGCLPSGGYTWCEREHACVRPWELAQSKGFELSAEGLRLYCAGAQQAGGRTP